MRQVSNFCDYFVISSATSLRQTDTIARAIEEELNKEKISPLSKVSYGDDSGWVVLDFTSVVAHVFHKPLREFYSLERLWSDAKRLRLTQSALK
jgi:ribosome-associated protein